MTTLNCCSIDHVNDRARAFLYMNPPYVVVSVQPNAVILERGMVRLVVKAVSDSFVGETVR